MCLRKNFRWKTGRINPETGKDPMTNKPWEGIGDPIPVPCGYCEQCVRRKAQDWAVRATHELSESGGVGCSLTLSYNDQNLPRNASGRPTLRKEDMQLFFHRYRKFMWRNFGRKIRMLYCGEYGDKTFRPHYHAVIFGHDFADKKFYKYSKGNRDYPLFHSYRLQKLWENKGFCYIGEANYLTTQYTAKYCTKKKYGIDAIKLYKGIEPPFVQSSSKPAIGIPWLKKYLYDVYPADHILVGGFKYGVPRTYDDYLEKADPELYERVKAERLAFILRHMKTHPEEYEPLRRRQKELYLKYRHRNSDRRDAA